MQPIIDKIEKRIYELNRIDKVDRFLYNSPNNDKIVDVILKDSIKERKKDIRLLKDILTHFQSPIVKR